jgi:hypothetical protein
MPSLFQGSGGRRLNLQFTLWPNICQRLFSFRGQVVLDKLASFGQDLMGTGVLDGDQIPFAGLLLAYLLPGDPGQGWQSGHLLNILGILDRIIQEFQEVSPADSERETDGVSRDSGQAGVWPNRDGWVRHRSN